MPSPSFCRNPPAGLDPASLEAGSRAAIHPGAATVRCHGDDVLELRCEPNSDSARFCNACGAEVAATAPPEVRKTVTVLFADVTGSTALGERLDPESLRRVLARYFEAASGCVERHGGTVEKFIGDAVMAVFGVPSMHEDDALRAAPGRRRPPGRARGPQRRAQRDYGVSLQLRTGVNTGEVVAGAEGERLATGDAVNVAARLEQAAQPGEILIGEQTCRLSRGAIEVEPVEPLALKGKADSVHAYRLLRVVEGAPAFGAGSTLRSSDAQRELARMRAAFDRAIVGDDVPPRHRARAAGDRQVAACARARRELADEATFSPAAAFRTARASPTGRSSRSSARQGPRTSSRLPSRQASAGGDLLVCPEGARALARERPLVLVVDDIHWAEPTLLDLVEHLALWTRDAPPPASSASRGRSCSTSDRPGAGGGSRSSRSPTPSPTLIEGAPRRLADRDDTRARISEVAEGNPLFVEQLLAMLAEGGDPEQVPPTIHALLAARLDGLAGRGARRARARGRRRAGVQWEALGELAPGRRRPPARSSRRSSARSSSVPHEAIEDTFRFRHMLIREAAYERHPEGSCAAELHERFADWLDGRGEELDEIVGYHLEQAYLCLAELGRPAERARALAEKAAQRLAGPDERPTPAATPRRR